LPGTDFWAPIFKLIRFGALVREDKNEKNGNSDCRAAPSCRPFLSERGEGCITATFGFLARRRFGRDIDASKIAVHYGYSDSFLLLDKRKSR
jgi:hypothetical protein